MFLVPTVWLTGVLLVWIVLAIAERNTTRRLMDTRWRKCLVLIAVAAVALSVIYASPFGPARDLESAMRWLWFGYPVWLLLSVIWLVPGVAASKLLELNPLWVMPGLALAIELSLESFANWPPSRWWPSVITGASPISSGYVLGFPVEAWEGYVYSLWPNAFMALVAAVSFLIARRLARS